MAAREEPVTTQIAYDPALHAYVVFWHGAQCGGLHEELEDAIDHAERLEASEDWDHANWREMTGSAEFAP